MSNVDFAVNKNVINGWNSKLNSSTVDLSRLVPFVNLLAVLDKDAKSALLDEPNQNVTIRNKTIDLNIISDSLNSISKSMGEIPKAIPLATISSPISLEERSKVVGINSLEISRGTAEKLNVRYTIKLTMLSPELFDTNPEYNLMTTLNSMFIIMYGWMGGKKGEKDLFVDPPIIDANTRTLNINVNDNNNGFWRTEVARLYKFDFSFTETGFIDITLDLSSPDNTMFTFFRTMSIAESAKKMLDPATFEYNVSDTTNRVLNSIDDDNIKRTPVITVEIPGATVTTQSSPNVTDKNAATTQTTQANPSEMVAAYYYLGWVFEAIKKGLNETSDNESNMKIDFRYRDIDYDSDIQMIYDRFFIPGDNSKVLAGSRLSNVFQIPLYKETIDAMFTSDQGNMPISNLITSLLQEGVHALQGIKLTCTIIDGIVEIFVASVNTYGLEKDMLSSVKFDKNFAENAFLIDFGTKTSLCRSIDMSSRMDPTSFEVYKMPVIISGIAKDNLSLDYVRSLLVKVGLDKDFDQIVKEFEEAKKTDQTIKYDPSSVVSKMIIQNPENYRKIILAFMGQQQLTWNLLGYFLKRTTVTIHGTVGINPYNFIVIRGLLKKLQGIYNIIQVTEQVTPTEHTTILEAALKTPEANL